MSDVVNQFHADTVRFSRESRTVFLSSKQTQFRPVFGYDIDCKVDRCFRNVNIFFSLKSMKCLFVVGSGDNYSCAIMTFWIMENSTPVPNCKWLLGQDDFMRTIRDDFAEKYAAYLIDEAINA